MVYRHTLLTRLTHATFTLAFAILALTGTQMFAHLHLLHANVKNIHLYAGFAMIAVGSVYAANGFFSGEFGKLLFKRGDALGLVPMIAYYLRMRSSPPAYDGYNPLQKLSYTIVLLTIGPLLALTGLAMWGRIGGRASGLWHLGFAGELVLFFFGHMAMVALTGLRKNLRAIVTGWYETGVQAPALGAATAPRRRTMPDLLFEEEPPRRRSA